MFNNEDGSWWNEALWFLSLEENDELFIQLDVNNFPLDEKCFAKYIGS